jgi:hypothetical protein
MKQWTSYKVRQSATVGFSVSNKPKQALEYQQIHCMYYQSDK